MLFEVLDAVVGVRGPHRVGVKSGPHQVLDESDEAAPEALAVHEHVAARRDNYPLRAAYDEAAHRRLRDIKRRFDPRNLFRLNHDIPPAEDPMTDDDTLQLIADRAAIADTVHRYAAGLDFGDAELLTSSLTEDATVDLTPATAKIGLDFPVLAPRETVVGVLIPAVGPLDTSHVISNIRTAVDGDTANVQCYAMAQHFPPGEGPRPERTRQALMMNRYDADLVRDDKIWRIRRLTIDSAWFSGDPTVLMPSD